MESSIREAGARPLLQVFDRDPTRLERWGERPTVERLPLASGDDALRPPAPALLLVDPYDLFERWEQLLPRAVQASAPSGALLLYLFNKAPRGAKAYRRYRELRGRLERLLAEDPRELAIGRMPSDAILPRAFHEVLLIAPPRLLDSLAAPLAQATRRLGRLLSDAGAFERPSAKT